jgi:hypothetical protein
VDVWTEDGAVARADEQGKFSFTNLRVGTHHFRADPASIPDGFAVPPAGDGLVSVRVTGWNTPQVLLPVWPQELVHAYEAAGGGGSSRSAPAEVGTPAAVSVDTVRIAVARSDEARSAARDNALFGGPPVEFFGVPDGAVVPRNRIFIGARSEVNVPVALFRGDSLLVEGHMRPDGVHDFMSMPLELGPNLFRVRVTNSWRQERWDSLSIHLSGPVDRFAVDSATIVLPADGRTLHRTRVRVLDAWGVPVVNGPYITVAGEHVDITSDDATRSSTGIQVQVDPQGWAEIEFRAGGNITRGAVVLSAGEAELRVPVDLVAPVLPLMVVATGQVGIGAAPDAYGALTARGRVADGTSLTVSVDSRRLDDGQLAFGRSVDPFSEGIYPITGDSSAQRMETASRGRFSARLERGFDFVAAGDIRTTLGAEENTLARYSRSLTGAAGRLETGSLVWTGFGSVSSQSLRQVQLRGLGTSGPYLIDQSVIPGTEIVAVELRDRENAQRPLSRRVLSPFVDYEIDYRNGTILLKQPLPSTDSNGNPIYLVVTAETRGAGNRAAIWGGRVQADAARIAGLDTPGSVLVGGSIIHDGQGLEPVNLVAGDVRVAAFAGVELRGEVAHSTVGDTAGFASSVMARSTLLNGRLALDGRWTRTGESFRNPSNVGLRGATEDLNVRAALTMARGQLRFEHSRQEFATQGVTRNRNAMSYLQPLAGNLDLEARVTADEVSGVTPRSGGAGEFKLTWSPHQRMRVWGESRNRLWAGDTDLGMGDYYGAGMAYQIMKDLALEARHLQVSAPDGSDYAVTNMGLRSTLAGGTQAWGSYQLVGGMDGGTGAALVGLNHRMTFGDGWRLNGMFERRVGVDRAPVDDPIRALPFFQREADYWSFGGGMEFIRPGAPYRFSARAERKQGDAESMTLGTLAGDVALGGSFALLARQEFMEREAGPAATGSFGRTERRSSILGLALRPSEHDNINALVEFRWLVEQNPRGAGVLSQQRSDERLIGAAEVIWAPLERLDLGVRFAHRHARTALPLPDFPTAEIRNEARYLGGRAELDITHWLGLRTEARLLDELRSGNRTWDVAPSLVLHAIQGIELTAGHRWGELQDRDFAVNGGKGFFLTLGARITERTLPTAAAFWRNRIGSSGHGDVLFNPSQLPGGQHDAALDDTTTKPASVAGRGGK